MSPDAKRLVSRSKSSRGRIATYQTHHAQAAPIAKVIINTRGIGNPPAILSNTTSIANTSIKATLLTVPGLRKRNRTPAKSRRSSRLLKYSPPTVRDSRPAATIKPPTDQTDEPSMRGADTFTESLFTMRHLDDFVPLDHPLRVIRIMVNKALANMDNLFGQMYAADIKGGRPSIAPEKLLRAMLIQVLYSVRSERQLM
eukprot:gene69208-94859_t